MTPQMSIAITGKNMAKPAFDAVVGDANRAAGAIDATGGRMATAMGGASFQTANLAAQFNDIGVMLAAGQSPLILAIQQGTQISQVLGPMGAAQAAGALKTALLSLLSPVTLITVGAIAAGAAAIQWLMSTADGAETATEALERHRKALSESVDGYGAAEAAVNSYLDTLSRLPRSIAAEQLRGQFEAIAGEIDAFEERAELIGGVFDGFGSQAEQELSTLAAEFASGSISAQEFYSGLQDVRGNLNAVENALSAISVAKLIDEMEQGALKAIQFSNGIANLVAQSHALAGIAADSELATFFEQNSVEGALDALKSMTPELRTQQQIIADTYSKALTNPALTDAGRAQLSQAKEEALAAVETAAARREASKAATEQSDAYGDLIGNLEHELLLVSMSSREQAVLNNVRAAGVELYSEQGLAIRQMTEELYDQQVAVEAVDKAQRDFDQSMNFYRSTFSGLFSDLKRGLQDGKNGWQAFADAGANALDRIADRALGMAADGIFDMIFGSLMGAFGGGNSLGGGWGIAGGFGMPGIYGIPGMATGGTVADAGLSWVGEDGPELLNLPKGAQVIPNAPSMAMAAIQNPAAPVFNINIDARGAERNAGPSIAMEVRRALPDAYAEFQRNPYRRPGTK